jgi:hypothetical protein
MTEDIKIDETEAPEVSRPAEMVAEPKMVKGPFGRMYPEGHLPQTKANRNAKKAHHQAPARPAIILGETESKPTETSLPKATEAPVQNPKGIVWFGEVDLNHKGVPGSDYPGWFFERQFQDLQNEITQIERGFDLDMYTGKDKLKMREELAKRVTRRDAIANSLPSLRGKDKDEVWKVFKDLGERIGESMFTYSDMQRGTADAHVEATRMVNPCIELKHPHELDYCRQRGIAVVNGKISRNHASQMAQTFGRVLGEGILDMERFRNQR